MLNFQQLESEFAESISAPDFVKVSFGKYKGDVRGLKKIIGKPVLIKQQAKFSLVYRYQTRDVTKNVDTREFLELFRSMIGYAGFQSVVVQTVDKNKVYSMAKKGDWKHHTEQVAERDQPSLKHDRVKQRSLNKAANAVHWRDLGLTDAEGNVYKAAQDKWKQINHYIDILSSALAELPEGENIRVVDMGAGKGYLTFALYDYLTNVLKRQTEVQGVEYREDLVELCNRIAQDAQFDGLRFRQGTIQEFDASTSIDILIALHACDTATDDAIDKGIRAGASLIVVAPCCHKQVRRELAGSQVENDLEFMTRHGIFMERHAEMLTDSIRALIMEYYGYKTKVLQFISDQHTPKNVMIIGQRVGVNKERQQELLTKLKSIKQYFGLTAHHLEKVTGVWS